MSGLLAGAILAASIGLTPVPAEPLPDPLAWGYLGVRVDNGTLMIQGVEPNTPAAKIGLQPGDQIARIGDLTPATFTEVAEHISTYRPGSRLKIVIRRENGVEKEFVVRLGVRPAEIGPPPFRGRVVPFDPDE